MRATPAVVPAESVGGTADIAGVATCSTTENRRKPRRFRAAVVQNYWSVHVDLG